MAYQEEKAMEKNNSGEQIMTVQEVAAYLKINVYTLYKMAERGAIPVPSSGH